MNRIMTEKGFENNIVEKDEEVLRADDPRNIRKRGAGGIGGDTITINIDGGVFTTDMDELATTVARKIGVRVQIFGIKKRKKQLLTLPLEVQVEGRNPANAQLCFGLFHLRVHLLDDQRRHSRLLAEIVAACQVLNLVVEKGTFQKGAIQIIITLAH